MSGFRPRFFIDDHGPGSQVLSRGNEGIELVLGSSDSHHALRVLRLKAGDPCEVVVGAAVYAASVSGETEPLKVRLERRLEGQEAGAVYSVPVGVVQALTRHALLDQVLEKGTEVGASFFILAQADGSTRVADLSKPSRMERWQRIVVEAAKQSKQSRVPTVELAKSLEVARDTLTGQGIFSLVLEPAASASLVEALDSAGFSHLVDRGPKAGAGRGDSISSGIALWVGPESGWSDHELEGFATAGIGSARMGQAVLRAETAGPVSVAVTRFVIGDW